MRPNASGTTRANTSLTIGSLNDRKIFVTRSSAGSITCGTIHKRSKAYFVLFFNSHVELLMRAYIVGAPITLPVNILAIISAGLLELIQGLRRRQVSNNSDVAPSGVVSSDFPSRSQG